MLQSIYQTVFLHKIHSSTFSLSLRNTPPSSPTPGSSKRKGIGKGESNRTAQEQDKPHIQPQQPTLTDSEDESEQGDAKYSLKEIKISWNGASRGYEKAKNKFLGFIPHFFSVRFEPAIRTVAFFAPVCVSVQGGPMSGLITWAFGLATHTPPAQAACTCRQETHCRELYEYNCQIYLCPEDTGSRERIKFIQPTD